MAKIIGIYGISFTDENDIKYMYIGGSRDIKRRWSWHRATFKKNNHDYSQLQQIWNEDENLVKFEIVDDKFDESITDKQLGEIEDYYVKYFNKIDNVIVININQGKIFKRGKVKNNTLNMSKAQQGTGNGHNTKLSESDVIWIRNLYKTGEMTIAKIAEMFHISPTHCSNVINKIKWSHI